ncbi:MAG: GIY-YIG nuclease family protein [Ignavibacteriales bacterium]|nr:GIY-YIG nuclease family protein [Ignavibacteriales bacterium]
MPFVYVLWSHKLRKRYIGSTRDLAGRLSEHNSGQSHFTRGGRPWILIHSESCGSVAEARKREHFLKSGLGRQWLDQQYPQLRNMNSEGCESG